MQSLSDTPKSNSLFKLLLWIFDTILFPALIAWLVFYPHFNSGKIDYSEDGQYLAVIGGIFQGQVLYRDIYPLFGPLSYWLPALWMICSEVTVMALRWYFVVGNIAFFVAIYFLCRLLIPHRVLGCICALLIVSEAAYPFWSCHWGGFRFLFGYLTLLSLIFYCRQGRFFWLLLAGALTALGSLASADVGWLCFISCAVFLVSQPQKIKRIFWYLTGFVLIYGIFLIYLGAHHALFDFWNEVLATADKKVWAHKIDTGFRDALEIYYPILLYVVYAWMGLRVVHEKALLRAIWVFGVLAYVLSYRALSGPQFEMGLPVCWMLLFYFLANSFTKLREDKKNQPVFLLLIILTSGFFLSQKVVRGASDTRETSIDWFMYQRYKGNVIAHFDILYPVNMIRLKTIKPSVVKAGELECYDFQVDEVEKIYDLIEANTSKEDILFTYPDLAFYNFLCDRPALGRFYVSSHSFPRKVWVDEVLSDLKREKPRYALMRNGLSIMAISIVRDEEVCPEIRDYILEHYQPVLKCTEVTVYELKKA